MGRISASLSGTELLLLNRLAEANAAAALNSLRLTTGKKVNSPADDPSAFTQIAFFESERSAVQATAANVTAASSAVSQSQLTLDQIRTQLNSIRTALLTDEDQSLTADQRTAKQGEIDTALDAIRGLARTVIDGKRILEGSADFRTSGRDASQITDVQVYSVGAATVTSPGQQAVLTYSGTDGLITAAANITVLGNEGGLTFNVATSDSLAEVANTVNRYTDTTGVVAEAVDDTLYLRSAEAGNSEFVEVDVNSGTFNVQGGTAGKDLGTAPTLGAGPSIAGSVDVAATQATLKHDAGGATIGADANFTLTGRLGEATIDVLAAESLSLADFATRVNNQSHLTGVVASVQATEIVFTSVDSGSREEVTVAVNSGTFATVDENDVAATTDNGTDAVVTINGQTLRGQSDAAAARLVHHTPGTIQNDAQIEITGPDGSDTITIDVVADSSLTGLRDAINGVNGNTGVTASIEGNDLVLETDDVGASATLEVRTISGSFAVDGGNGDRTAQGSDAVNGVAPVDGNHVTIVDGKLHAEVEFAVGFTGSFSTVNVNGGGLAFALSTDLTRPSTLAIASVDTFLLGGVSGNLEDLRTAGSASGLSTNTSSALRIVDEALADLSRVDGVVDGFANAAIASASALSTARDEDLSDTIDSINAIDENEEALLLAKNQDLAANAVASLAILDQQRTRIVDLIQQLAGF